MLEYPLSRQSLHFYSAAISQKRKVTPRMEIEHKQKMLAVAEGQKHMIWAVLCQLAGIIPYVGLVAIIYSLWAIYKMGKALENKYAWLLVIATLIPLVGLIVLLVTNNTATKFLEASGVKVGFMGAKKEDMERLQQDITVASMPLPPQLQQ